MKSFLPMVAGIAATALVGGFASHRFTRAGEWLPRPPAQIGIWEAEEETIPPETLGLLGNPQALAFNYRSPFSERVQVSMVAAGPFENYHDPTVCVGEGAFRLTASKTIPLDGPGSGKVRAMIFKHRAEPKIRIVMYYWQQNRNGSTDYEPRMGNYRDMAARFQTGFSVVARGQQTIILRNYMMFHEDDDPLGIHAQQCVHEVSRAIYRALKEDH
ncbi:MAG: exosortase-associated EpsI family protein [Armatimonas sp.]